MSKSIVGMRKILKELIKNAILKKEMHLSPPNICDRSLHVGFSFLP